MAAVFQWYRIRKQIEEQVHERGGNGDALLQLPCFHANNVVEHEGKPHYVVEWDGADDPENPLNYSAIKKALTMGIVTLLAIAVTIFGSIDTPVLHQAASEYHVALVAEVLDIGMYFIGFALGALIAGPISEVLGRSATYVSNVGIMLIWLMAVGLSPNFGAMVIFRFFTGVFGASPLVCSGGTVADLYNRMEKTIAFPLYACFAFSAAGFGPVISAWIPGHIAWRWSYWLQLIIGGLVLIIMVAVQPETYAPVLLEWKAKRLRELTGDHRFCALHEITGTDFLSKLKVALSRPFIMAVQEPIIQLASLYLTVVYIILFTFLDGYEIIFTAPYNLSIGITYTIFVALSLGIYFGLLLVPFVYWRTKIAEQEHGILFPAEMRLWFAMFGAIPIPISLFWMGWTCYPSVSVWSPIIASGLSGFGFVCIFMTVYMYLIDCYEKFAASALSFLTLTRYLASGGMVVVGVPFYNNMNPHWTLTILGAISALLVPLPYIAFFFGDRIREHSNFAAVHKDTQEEEQRAEEEEQEREEMGEVTIDDHYMEKPPVVHHPSAMEVAQLSNNNSLAANNTFDGIVLASDETRPPMAEVAPQPQVPTAPEVPQPLVPQQRAESHEPFSQDEDELRLPFGIPLGP